MSKITLISHLLCPYVQRAVIAMIEKSVCFDRIDIDLANKPDWFKALSPLGKTPVLKVEDTALFESAVILEYLEETQPKPLHPGDPLQRAEHRAWIEYGSTILNDIWGFYTASNAVAFNTKTEQLSQRLLWLEKRLIAAPWFDGPRFSLVDAVFGPVFRYFDTFDSIADFSFLSAKPKLRRWRESLASRSSVQQAVSPDYPRQLMDFLIARKSHLSQLIESAGVQ
jgi:glutathione S-transferase